MAEPAAALVKPAGHDVHVGQGVDRVPATDVEPRGHAVQVEPAKPALHTDTVGGAPGLRRNGGGKRAARVPLTNDCSMLAQTDAHCAVAGEPAQNGTRGNKLDSRLHCAADVALLAAVVLPPGHSVQGGLGAAGVPPMP